MLHSAQLKSNDRINPNERRWLPYFPHTSVNYLFLLWMITHEIL